MARQQFQRLFLALLVCGVVMTFSQANEQSDESQQQQTIPSDVIIAELDTIQEQYDRHIDRNFDDLTVLGFLTPWNTRGEEIALTQTARSPSRLDIVSPVTYQFKLDGLHGGHDYSESFYKRIKEKSPSTLIMPRVIFEQERPPPGEKPKTMYTTDKIVDSITAEWKKNEFDGVVLEMWQTVMPLTDKSYDILRLLAKKLREKGLVTSLVIPPFHADVPQMNVTSVNMNRLADSFSFFVVMTYDYSTPSTDVGPVAPLPWVKKVLNYFVNECGLGSKILMGLNFYGVNFGEKNAGDKHEHIVGNQVRNVMEQYKPEWVWHKEAQEHFFQYTTDEGMKRIVFYPTRESIRARLIEANEIGCGGVAIWDVGQGLDYFFEDF